MHLFRVDLLNFRSHKEASFEFAPGINVIIGDNGCGKSNLLEGIFVLTRGRSFRTSQDDALIQLGERAAVIRGRLKGEKRDSKIEIGIDADVGKEIRLNGIRLEKLKDLRSSFGIALFSPEDLKLVKGGPEEKRGLMDEVGGDLGPKYDYARMSFFKVLKQRNSLLKQIKFGEQARSGLEIWNERLIVTGKRLIDERREIVQLLNEACQDVFNEIFGQRRSLSLIYSNEIFKKGASVEGAFKDLLEKVGADEIERGISLIGPHRDDLGILLEGREARLYASQGEQRIISLVLRLAYHELLCKDERRMSLFLMDDVMSEMDERRRDNLLNFISGLKQTIITSTNLYYFKNKHLKTMNMIEMGEGERKSRAG